MKVKKRNRRLLAKALILSLCITMLPIDALSMTVSAETEEMGTAVVPGVGTEETGTAVVSGAGTEGTGKVALPEESGNIVVPGAVAEGAGTVVVTGADAEGSGGSGVTGKTDVVVTSNTPDGGATVTVTDGTGTEKPEDGETKDSEGEETKNPNDGKGGEGGSSDPSGNSGNVGSTVEPDFEWEGQGTEQSPYLIQSEAELLGLAKSVNAGNSYKDQYFLLTEDLDLSSVCGADLDGKIVNWEPIGYAADITFYGNFDGNDNSISNLYIEAGTSDYQGLFGTISGTVKNLNVSGTVNGGSRVGGIAGYVIGTITDCEFSGEVQGTDYVGGIAGVLAPEGTLTYLTSDAAVFGKGTCVGGIVGWANGIPGAKSIWDTLDGGFVDYGKGWSYSEDITDCTFEGMVSYLGDSHADTIFNVGKGTLSLEHRNDSCGGIAGACTGRAISYCYNEGTIIQGAQMAGGVIGISYRNDVQDCANYGTVICPQNSTNFKLKAKEQQQEEQQQQQEGIRRYIKPVVIRYGGETFITNDTRERISSMKGNGGIAGISWLGTIETCENYGEVDSHVTAGGIVGFAHETKVSECVNRTGGSVTSNVNAGGIMGEGWSIKQFEECVNYGTITAKSDLGGICGFCQGHIKKCNNHGTLIGDANQDSMGGIVGYVEDGSVTECYNNGDIGVFCNYEGYDSGGIAGLCMTSTISYCLNAGGVQGGTNVGGIVGSLQLESLVTECKNLGDVTSLRDDIACVGGIVGLCISNNKNGHMDGGSTISKCVNGAGTTVSARRFNVGGIVGQLHTGKVLDCYNLGIVHGEASVGGIAGIISGRQIELCRNYCMAPSEYPGGGYGIDKTDVNGLAGGVIGYTKTADVQIHDNYWWTSCSARAYGWRSAPTIEGEVKGYDNLNQFTVATNFNNWDFNTVWTMVGQPVLRYETEMSGFFAEAAQEQDESILDDPYGLGGGGSVVIQGPTGGYGSSFARTLCIWSVDDLKNFRNAVNQGDDYENAMVVLCTDLNLTGEDWIPVGTYNNDDYWDDEAWRPFLGSFDGRGHSINGLYADCGELPAGFFGYIGKGGKVSNLYVSGSVKSAGRAIGGIVGHLDDGGRIENCVFEGTVTGCGGADCVNDEEVNNAPVVGGIVGRSLGYLYYCYHVGDVTTEYGFAGGVAGRLQGSGNRMNYCFQYGGNISGGRIGKTLYNLNTTTGGLIGMASSTYVNDSYCACTGTNRVFGYQVSSANNSWNVAFVDAAWLKNVQNLTTNGKNWDISDEAGHIWGMGENYPVLQVFSKKVTLDPDDASGEAKTVWISRWEDLKPNAQPESDMVVIRFRGNGGSNFMDSISVVKGETISLPANEFTRIGYDFGGWKTGFDESDVQYGDQQSITVDQDLCLYATWLPVSYTIGFATNGTNHEILYSEVMQSGKTPVYGGAAPTYVGASTGTEDQWIFDGWSPMIDVVAGEFTYQAKFVNKLQEYSISVQFGTADLATAMAGEQVQITAGAPGTGKVFDHWESSDVTVMNPMDVTTSFTMPRKNVFITAVYKNASYPVTLDTQGGTINDGNVTTYTYGEGASLPTDVTKDHYMFEGWYTGRNGTGSKAEVIGMDETGERTFYAYWKPVPYDVTIQAGNGMSLKAGSGAETQMNVTEEIISVVYVAAEGYCFPDYYYTASKDGLTVTRDSVSQITVSGRPTADVQLTLRDAIAKEQEDTPEAEFNATGTDSGTLSHLVVGAKYVVTFSVYDEVSGTWVAGTVSPMEFTATGINQSITGLSEGLLGIVRKGGDTTLDSKKEQFTIYGGIIPDYVETEDCTGNDSNDGAIRGVNNTMDYRKSGDTDWTIVTGQVITGLAPGTYELRVRPDGTQLASEIKTVMVWSEKPDALDAVFGHTCSFQNRITINYKITADLSTYDDFWLAIERQTYTGAGEEFCWETAEVRDWYLDPDDGRYVFPFDDIAAAEMGEVIRAKVVAVKDGMIYESAVDEYSLKTYAENRIRKSDDPIFRKLMVDMLNYGAAAQVYFKKNTNHLANADLTEDERKQGTQEEVTPVVIESVTDNVAETARIVSKSVAFKSGVELNAHVNYDAEPAEDEKVWVELTYVATSGDSKRQVVTRDKFVRSVKDGVVRYSAAFDIIATPDFGKEVTLKVFRTVEEDGVSTDVQISETYTYSLETYAANRLANSENENFKALLRAMLKYERSALAYFTRTTS